MSGILDLTSLVVSLDLSLCAITGRLLTEDLSSAGEQPERLAHPWTAQYHLPSENPSAAAVSIHVQL
jgi:hypothetical protein